MEGRGREGEGGREGRRGSDGGNEMEGWEGGRVQKTGAGRVRRQCTETHNEIIMLRTYVCLQV